MQAIIFSFISLAISLFFLELSLGLLLFHCLDRCFSNKYGIFHSLQTSNNNKQQNQVIYLSKDDYSLFTNRDNDEAFDMIDGICAKFDKT